MFNKYPYTNFHELNLEYFIKHFEEIFAQWESLYNELQDWKTGTTEELEAWKTEVENGIADEQARVLAELEAWKTETGEDIDDWEASVLTALNSWKSDFETLFATTFANLTQIKTDAETARDAAQAAQEAAEDAQEAAEDVAQSIASSADQITSNANNIDIIKKSITNLTGNNIFYDFDKNRYINTANEYVDIENKISNATRDCVIIDCSEGDNFTITGHGAAAGAALYTFVGAETVIDDQTVRPLLARAENYLIAEDMVITAPENSEKLVINVINSYEYYICSGIIINKAFDYISDVKTYAQTEFDYIRKINSDISNYNVYNDKFVSGGDATFGTLRNDESSTYTDFINVLPKSIIEIKNAYTYGSRAIIAYDSELKPIKPALATNSGITNILTVIVTLPETARYIRITGKKDNPNPTCKYLSIALDGDDYVYNLISDTATDGNYVSAVSGGTPTDASSCYTDYVRVKSGSKIIIKNLFLTGNRSVYAYGKYGTFADGIGALISNSESTAYEFVVPDNVYYIRATGNSGTPPLIYMSEPTINNLKTFYNNVNLLIPKEFADYKQEKIVTYVDDDAINLTALGLLENACDDLSTNNNISVRCSISAITKLLVAPREDYQDRVDLLKRLELKGFHICNHTNDHSRWYTDSESGTMFTVAEAEEDLIKSIRILNELGFIDAARYFVYTGSSQTRTELHEMVRKWTDLACTISAGNNIPENNTPYWLYRCHIDGSDASHTVQFYADQLESLERNGNNWIIYYSHCKNYTPDPTTGRAEWTADLFKGVIQNAIDHGYKVMTLNQAWKYRKGNYLIQDLFGK